MNKITYVAVIAGALALSGCAADQGAGPASGNTAQAKAAAKPVLNPQTRGTTPTVAEVKATMSGRVSRGTNPRGMPRTINWRPNGVFEMDLETPRETLNMKGKWWVDKDSSLCREFRGGDGLMRKACTKLVKVQDRLYRLDAKGNRLGDGVPIKE